ncbi:hypothetical protein ACFVYC_12135 [Pseudarthrobacter sp. NPDC058329]|uniref:hypothetical protein n=1 Tax=Pseudarthrobacter sp. NPDC058329 TaxID=3346448 RepID=UPI0036DEEB46
MATVIFLTAVAPLATDMYVPAFPRVAGEFGTTASAVQLTLTTFFAGMGLGEHIAILENDEDPARTTAWAEHITDDDYEGRQG